MLSTTHVVLSLTLFKIENISYHVVTSTVCVCDSRILTQIDHFPTFSSKLTKSKID